jgi:hypothetical protein
MQRSFLRSQRLQLEQRLSKEAVLRANSEILRAEKENEAKSKQSMVPLSVEALFGFETLGGPTGIRSG